MVYFLASHSVYTNICEEIKRGALQAYSQTLDQAKNDCQWLISLINIIEKYCQCYKTFLSLAQ
jgi:hypothetical protein